MDLMLIVNRTSRMPNSVHLYLLDKVWNSPFIHSCSQIKRLWHDKGFYLRILYDALSSFQYSQKTEWNARVGYYIFFTSLHNVFVKLMERWSKIPNSRVKKSVPMSHIYPKVMNNPTMPLQDLNSGAPSCGISDINNWFKTDEWSQWTSDNKID